MFPIHQRQWRYAGVWALRNVDRYCEAMGHFFDVTPDIIQIGRVTSGVIRVWAHEICTC